MKLVKRPPIIGATTRFIIMSAPVPRDHMMGISPVKAAATVIIFGRMSNGSEGKEDQCPETPYACPSRRRGAGER